MSRIRSINNCCVLKCAISHPAGPGLFPWQFSQLAKYDVTGIGLNIGEVANGQGGTTLKVLGLVLGSPAQSAGVRQVCVDFVALLFLIWSTMYPFLDWLQIPVCGTSRMMIVFWLSAKSGEQTVYFVKWSYLTTIMMGKCVTSATSTVVLSSVVFFFHVLFCFILLTLWSDLVLWRWWCESVLTSATTIVVCCLQLLFFHAGIDLLQVYVLIWEQFNTLQEWFWERL
jgi:hypothetical protein